MKLALVLLLLIPACYCSDVATVCDHTGKYLSAGLYLEDDKFKELVESHAGSKDGIAAAIKLRHCFHEHTPKERDDYARLLDIIMGGCPDEPEDSSR